MFNYSRLLGSEQCFRVVTKETGSHEVFAGEIYFGFRFGRNRCYRIVCRLYVPHRPTHVVCDILDVICRGGIMARNKLSMDILKMMKRKWLCLVYMMIGLKFMVRTM